MSEHRVSILALAMPAAFVVLAACAPPPDGGGIIPGPSADAGAVQVGTGHVCASDVDCASGRCEKLFVCERDRAVSCNRDMNDCAANGLSDSACVEEPTGTCTDN
jgi:hypothetical protein